MDEDDTNDGEIGHQSEREGALTDFKSGDDDQSNDPQVQTPQAIVTTIWTFQQCRFMRITDLEGQQEV